MKTHNTHNRHISIPPAGFEPTISAGERPETHPLDRAATGSSRLYRSTSYYFFSLFVLLSLPSSLLSSTFLCPLHAFSMQTRKLVDCPHIPTSEMFIQFDTAVEGVGGADFVEIFLNIIGLIQWLSKKLSCLRIQNNTQVSPRR